MASRVESATVKSRCEIDCFDEANATAQANGLERFFDIHPIQRDPAMCARAWHPGQIQNKSHKTK